ncbi:MAG: hypothetical protein Q8S58_00385 [Bosea sp. (in: a-proteobacteria)]|nr:hypothetical protein [Bosea sp. (in: a-proteobacteria)]
MNDHDHLTALLGRLKLTALRDQLDSLIDEAGRRELTIREALTLFCEREVARRDQRRIDMSFGLARFPFVRDLTGGRVPSRGVAEGGHRRLPVRFGLRTPTLNREIPDDRRDDEPARAAGEEP